MSQTVLASGNKGKLAELMQLLAPLNITMRPQTEFGIGTTFPEAEETGLTFVENAIIKARHATKISKLPAIADDSGLEVDRLNGEPGIYSARYAGADATAVENNQKLLKSLQGLQLEERTARFHCVIVYLQHEHDHSPLIAHGKWDGLIAEEMRGNNGFGYDPLFMIPEENRTIAELPQDFKNKVSHRAQALKQLIISLRDMRDSK